MSLRPVVCCVLAILPLANAGCLLPFGPLDVQTAVSRSAGVRLKQDLGLTTDGLTLALLSGLSPVRLPVGHITWVSLGVYEIQGQDNGTFGRLDLPGWERLALVRDGGSEVLTFVQAGDKPFGGMAVLVREEDELIIVKVLGRLEKFVEETLGPGGWGMVPEEPAPARLVRTRPAPGSSTSATAVPPLRPSAS